MNSPTPGPWRIGYDDGSGAGEDNEGIYIIAVGEEAVVRGGRDDYGIAHGVVCMEDAHLIAAAPDLYKQLRHLVILIEPLEHNGALQIPGLATLNAARAALAKADGKP